MLPLMTRRERRLKRARERRRRLAKMIAIAAVIIAISVGLLMSAVTFAPLVEAEDAPDYRQIAQEAGYSQPLDAFGVSSLALDSLFKFLAANNWRLFLIAIMHDHWIHIGRCEQPGNGYGGINWSADGFTSDGHFQGGLGISTDAWRENNTGLPASALQATPFEQMQVATRIYLRFGAGAWACK